MTIEIWTLYAVALTATILRTYARIRAVGFKGLRPDDYFVWAGTVCPPTHTMGKSQLADVMYAAFLHSTVGSGMECRICRPRTGQQRHDRCSTNITFTEQP